MTTSASPATWLRKALPPRAPATPAGAGPRPRSFTFSSAGVKTAYGWVKDAAGNISSSRSAGTTITLPDVTAPTLNTFTLPATASSLTVPISAFSASDNIGVTGYLVTESATAPSAGDSGWSGTAPSSYTFSSAGVKTAYGWVKDAAGNISSSRSAGTTITLPDVTAPTLNTFTLPATASSLTVPISAFSASDNIGVTGYLVTESATAPSAGDSGWSGTAPSSYTFSSAGVKTAYGWVKDAAGNISSSRSASTTITLPDVTAPTLNTFTLPATASSLTVPISAFSASDNIGVTGYLVTESATAPSAGDSGWSGTAPSSYHLQLRRRQNRLRLGQRRRRQHLQQPQCQHHHHPAGRYCADTEHLYLAGHGQHP